MILREGSVLTVCERHVLGSEVEQAECLDCEMAREEEQERMRLADQHRQRGVDPCGMDQDGILQERG